MPFLLFILFLFLAVGVSFLQKARYEEKIKEMVATQGGEFISLERRNFIAGLGPFMMVGKGRSVYRFEYRVGTEIREGWVKFGNLFGPDWRL